MKDDDGRIVKEIDPLGNETVILYDDLGQPFAKRDPLGYERQTPADPTPHPLSHRLPENPLQWQQGDWPSPSPSPRPGGSPPRIQASRLPGWVTDAWGDNSVVPPPRAPVLVTDVQGLAIREEGGEGRVRHWSYDPNWGVSRWYTDYDGKTTRYDQRRGTTCSARAIRSGT